MTDEYQRGIGNLTFQLCNNVVAAGLHFITHHGNALFLKPVEYKISHSPLTWAGITALNSDQVLG